MSEVSGTSSVQIVGVTYPRCDRQAECQSVLTASSTSSPSLSLSLSCKKTPTVPSPDNPIRGECVCVCVHACVMCVCVCVCVCEMCAWHMFLHCTRVSLLLAKGYESLDATVPQTPDMGAPKVPGQRIP